ncbi:MAG: AAA family ATPase, partial [Planctomycetota bacterium]
MSNTPNQPTNLKLASGSSDSGRDFWADVPAVPVDTPRTGGAGVMQRKQADPLDQARRLLRGRWPLLIVLAAGGAMVGGMLGWQSQTPTYEAAGRISYRASIPRMIEGTQGVAGGFKAFLSEERTRIAEHPDIAQAAIETDVWQETESPMRWETFQWRLNARHTGGDNVISVRFTDENPRVAEAAVRATLNAYRENFNNRRSLQDGQLLFNRESALSDLQARLAGKENDIASIARSYGGTEDLGGVATLIRAEVEDDRETLAELERDLGNATRLRDSADTLMPTDLAVADEGLMNLLRQRDATRAELARLMRDYGAGNRQVQNLRNDIASLDEEIELRSESVRQVFFGTMPNLTDGVGELINVTTDYITKTEARVDDLSRRLAEREEQLKVATADREELARMTRERDKLFSDIDDLRAEIQQQRFDGMIEDTFVDDGIGWLDLTMPPEGSAYASQDRRLPMALGGMIFGAGVPTALVVLLGLLDKRTRFSDDASDLAAGIQGHNGQPAPLLGVLPNLPDRLSDPNQASIAAHCVHQIRTILQIHHAVPLSGSDGATEEPRSFAVTSAGRGEGKTSLALALGLSYAASGCRTLLVDTDLRSGGLSRRLDVQGDEGILDALLGGDLLQATCETEVANLAVLPIGNAKGSRAGVFSPVAVRQMLRQAKRNFDVILLDCGPILGSIEATPVAS